MPWDDAIEVGRVLRARGLEGELQVALHGDDPSNLLRARRVLLDAAPGCIPYLVERAEPLPHGRGEAPRVRLKLLGLDRRERAEAWQGARVLLEAGQLAPLEPGEYYWTELMGCRCVLEDGPELGVLEEIWPTPTHDLLVVRSGDRTRMIPILDGVIAAVDRAARTITLVLPEDFLLEEL